MHEFCVNSVCTVILVFKRNQISIVCEIDVNFLCAKSVTQSELHPGGAFMGSTYPAHIPAETVCTLQACPGQKVLAIFQYWLPDSFIAIELNE